MSSLLALPSADRPTAVIAYILVNNAGQHLKKPAVDTSDQELSGVLATHVFGSYALSRECGRRMMERGHGAIVLIGSMAALFGIPQVSAYTVAKAGLLGLTRARATEFSPRGVRVNAIAPGWIDTAITRQAHQDDPARRARILTRTPLGRLVVEDVMRVLQGETPRCPANIIQGGIP